MNDLNGWPEHQRAKGLRKYGVSLKDAGLTFDELARHAAQEVVDLVEYLGAMSEAGSHHELPWALRRARSLRETLCDIAGPAPGVTP